MSPCRYLYEIFFAFVLGKSRQGVAFNSTYMTDPVIEKCYHRREYHFNESGPADIWFKLQYPSAVYWYRYNHWSGGQYRSDNSIFLR